MGLPLAVARPGNLEEVTRLRESAPTGGATDSRCGPSNYPQKSEELERFFTGSGVACGRRRGCQSLVANTFTARAFGMAIGPLAGGWIFDKFGAYHWLHIGSFDIGLLVGQD